jgi:hypothetical protein
MKLKRLAETPINSKDSPMGQTGKYGRTTTICTMENRLILLEFGRIWKLALDKSR